MPSCDQLRLAARIAFNWIKRNYWSKYLNLLSNQAKSKQQIYEQTMMILTSLFVQDEDNLDRKASELAKMAKRNQLKKQKVESLKKFSLLDKQQIDLLNDTLYDLLNEDFYTTLYAITLYIVECTKEHLDMNGDQMIKWIEDDEVNMKLILSNQANQEKRKRLPLIPNYILNSFKPLFEIINTQLSSVNQLLFNLHSIIDGERIDLKFAAQVWFVQVTCALLNNLNFNSKQTIEKTKNNLTEFERCFKLSDQQLIDLKWIHLFTMLVEEPIMCQLNLSIVKRFYPLVAFRYSRTKFNQICELLAIYLDSNETNSTSRKKKMQIQDVDLNELEAKFSNNQLGNMW